MEHIVIIGNGIAGVTAARHIRKLSGPPSDHGGKKITLVSAESKHFFSRTALMYVYMGHMEFGHLEPYEDWFWEKNKIHLVQDYVKKVDTSTKKLILQTGTEVNFDTLIIACGSKPNKFGWPGQDLDGVQGLVSKQDLELLETNAPDKGRCKRAVVVGGGLIGIELCEMLRSRDIPVTFLVREDNFWDGVLPDGEAKMLNKHIREHHIDLRLGANLKEILSDDRGRARAVVVEETGEEIPCGLVGLTAGVSPNIDFLKDSGIELKRGVLVNRFLETSEPDIFAIGDCAEQREPIGNRPPVEAVWYTGRMMAEAVARTICGKRMRYDPGHWFNSAKFLDIEYQTYGWVFSHQRMKEYEAHFHWRHPTENVCITLAYHKESNQFLGINTFGIRMRHGVFDRWLSERRDVHHVMLHLRDANFDPEFYNRYEADIVSAYNSEYGTNLRPKRKSWARILGRGSAAS